MFFHIALYTSLLVFAAGLLYRFWTWLQLRIGPGADHHSPGGRVKAAGKDAGMMLFSPRLPWFLKSLLLDVILQVHILKKDRLRWIMHMGLYGGFMLLLLTHALDSIITAKLFSDYEPTLNPFLFLRNFFGFMVLAGAAIAIYRRINSGLLKKLTRGMDRYALVILLVIIGSGFLLESLKIISYPIFYEMARDYGAMDDPAELAPLKAYWAENYDVVFPGKYAPVDGEDLELGREMHLDNCAACHSRPASAFISYPVAKLVTPAALKLRAFRIDIWKMRADRWMYWIHVLACFIGLAYLPFSKMMHIVSTPISLLLFGTVDKKTDSLSLMLGSYTTESGGQPGLDVEEARLLNRRAMTLDACMHCGACSLHCSVGQIYRRIPNLAILPSEKIAAGKALARGELDETALRYLQEGNSICTGCFRCTSVCPAGLNLQDLWAAMNIGLVRKGNPTPENLAREAGAGDVMRLRGNGHKPFRADSDELNRALKLSSRADTFSLCFKCRTCSNVCPVVSACKNPKDEIDLMPHQIMHSLGLGMKELAMGSRMIWDCLTCYACQEHCPQNVLVADILYELKNVSYARHKAEAASKESGKES